jgi:hypothetical protein
MDRQCTVVVACLGVVDEELDRLALAGHRIAVRMIWVGSILKVAWRLILIIGRSVQAHFKALRDPRMGLATAAGAIWLGEVPGCIASHGSVIRSGRWKHWCRFRCAAAYSQMAIVVEPLLHRKITKRSGYRHYIV